MEVRVRTVRNTRVRCACAPFATKLYPKGVITLCGLMLPKPISSPDLKAPTCPECQRVLRLSRPRATSAV